jgi:hypothetical protein
MRPFVSRSLTPTVINELISVIPREKYLIAPLWFEDAQVEVWMALILRLATAVEDILVAGGASVA